MRELKNPFINGRIERDTSNVDLRVYHKHTVPRGERGYTMSRSQLVEFNHNPRRWLKGYGEKQTKSMKFGSLVDCLLLTPKKFDQLYWLKPEKYHASDGTMKDWTRASKTCRAAEDEAEANGRTVIDQYDRLEAESCVNSLLDEPEIRSLVNCSDTQVIVTADYLDEDTRLLIPLKFMLDLVPKLGSSYERILADLKTCDSADPRAWKKAVFNHKYHVQSAMYLDAYVCASGEDRTDFYHAVVESYFPYETACRHLSGDFLDLGRHEYHAALRRYARCLKDNVWPGYDTDSRKLVQGWALVEPDDWMVNQI